MQKNFALAGLIVLTLATISQAQSYSIDAIHSSFLFKIFHADTANFYGRFNKASGLIKTDANTPTELNIVVEAESVDTNNKARDEHLRGPDFFDTKQFTDITYKSTGIKKVDDTTYEVAGDLTMHGTTKPLTITLKHTGNGKNVQGKETIGFETTFTIKRSDFGVSGYIGKGLGDEVTMIISLESTKQ